MYQKKFFSKDVAISLQENAVNTAQAVQRMENSCGMCNKQGFCDKKRCPVYRAHLQVIQLFDAEAHAKKLREEGLIKTEYIETRDYEITDLASAKKSALRIMHTFLKERPDDAFVTKCRHYLAGRNYGLLEDYLRELGYYKKGRVQQDAYTKVVTALREVIKYS